MLFIMHQKLLGGPVNVWSKMKFVPDTLESNNNWVGVADTAVPDIRVFEAGAKAIISGEPPSRFGAVNVRCQFVIFSDVSMPSIPSVVIDPTTVPSPIVLLTVYFMGMAWAAVMNTPIMASPTHAPNSFLKIAAPGSQCGLKFPSRSMDMAEA